MAIIVTALATMIGLVKAADILKHCGAIVGIAIVFVLFVSVFVGLWSSMSMWQKVVASVVVFSVWRVRRERRQPRKKREED
jgi:Flp pilus assembly protein TadB